MDEALRGALDQQFQATVLDAYTSYLAILMPLGQVMAKRDRKVLDHDAARSHVKSLIDAPSADPTKLTVAEAKAKDAKMIYEELNQRVKREGRVVLSVGVRWCKLGMDAMVRCQAGFVKEALALWHGVDTKQVADSGGSTSGGLEHVLVQVRALPICASPP